MLHQVRTSPFAGPELENCLAHCQEGDAIVLIQDAVIAVTLSSWQQRLQAQSGVSLYVLRADLLARGLKPQFGQVIDDMQWVELSAGHQTCLSW